MAVSTASWAEEVTNGFIITIAGQETKVLFTENPVLTHSEDGTQVYLSRDGKETVTLDALNIAVECCTLSETGTGIELNIQNGENGRNVVMFDLNGRRVNKAVKGQVYVIDGKKVMVK